MNAPPPVVPGVSPWVLVKGHRGLSIRQGSANGRIVCTIPWRDADDEARARLIVQAWPLLLNLHRLADIVSRFTPRELFEPDLNDALEAIALASKPRGPASSDHRPASAEAEDCLKHLLGHTVGSQGPTIAQAIVQHEGGRTSAPADVPRDLVSPPDPAAI